LHRAEVLLAALVLLPSTGNACYIVSIGPPSFPVWLVMLTQTGFIIANKMTTAANAIMLQYASPLFVVIFGAIFYHYRPTRRETTALGIA